MNDRFKVIYYQDPRALEDAFKIIIDTETGVNYLEILLAGSGGASISPLYDSEGNIVISSKEELENIKEINIF